MRRVHVDAVAPAEQVAALDELDPHQAREQGVLEVGGVVHAGGEDHDERIDDAVRRRRAQRGEQPRRVLVDLVDLLVAEQRREQPGHGEPVLQDVADPGRDSYVVLKDAELALLVTDDVDARDVDADAVGAA